MKKIFYDNGKWWAFVPPVKPHEFIDEIEQYDIWQDYEKAYTEAKANALDVGNPEVIETMILDNAPKVGYDDFWPLEQAKNEVIDWKGSAVIKDGKYILTI